MRYVPHAAAVVLILAAAALYRTGSLSLARTELVSGPALFLTLVFLGTYAVSSYLGPRLGLLSPDLWRKLHIALGWSTIALFLVHTRGRIPTGYLERLVTALFVIVLVTGAIGRHLERGQDRDGEASRAGRLGLQVHLALTFILIALAFLHALTARSFLLGGAG